MDVARKILQDGDIKLAEFATNVDVELMKFMIRKGLEESLDEADQGALRWASRYAGQVFDGLASSLASEGKRPSPRQVRLHKDLQDAIRRGKGVKAAAKSFVAMAEKDVPYHWQDNLFDLKDILLDLKDPPDPTAPSTS